jgi:hypothetical protein
VGALTRALFVLLLCAACRCGEEREEERVRRIVAVDLGCDTAQEVTVRALPPRAGARRYEARASCGGGDERRRVYACSDSQRGGLTLCAPE